MESEIEINAAVLRGLFHINLKRGRLFWKLPPKNRSHLMGSEAGSPRLTHSGKSYWIVKINRRPYRRSHLIFLAAHGRFPIPCADHRNGDSLDDSLSNLREATVLQNAWNHKRRRKPSPLPMGVRQLTSGNYEARIRCKGRAITIGTFPTVSLATAAYQNKRQELFGEFA